MTVNRVVGVFVSIVLALLPARLFADKLPAYLAPTSIVDLLRPDKPASGVLGTLEEQGIRFKQEGPLTAFSCPPETTTAFFLTREDGMIAHSIARFDLSVAQAETFFALLRSSFGREGKESCKKDECSYVMKGWTAKIGRPPDAPGAVMLAFERTDGTKSRKEKQANSDTAQPNDDVDAPQPESQKSGDWSRPTRRGPYATAGYNYQDGYSRWRSGHLPPNAPSGSLAGVWAAKIRDGWDYLTFFLEGGAFYGLPGDGMNFVMPQKRRHYNWRSYSIKGDLLTLQSRKFGTTWRLRLLEEPNGRPLPYSHEGFVRLHRSAKARLCLVRPGAKNDRGTCYKRIDLCPESWRLAGTWQHETSNVSGGVELAPSGFVYENSFGNTSSVRGSTTYVSRKSVSWKFTGDGQVFHTREESTSALSTTGELTNAGGKPESQRGTYSIKGCELQVKWSSGERGYFFIRSEKGFDNPAVLYVGDEKLERAVEKKKRRGK